ncbi:hypothetical protein CYLTODRAFT_425844 [Cylindrobasidium torrendii FP15055 ss-10]|uniref:Uncharacterized protein n=1 Tax=Cylindrobasidium torrendii FP15055 ss-10 TaxID=1314674 RepID=A0A0D7B0T2_9AGAR|nr:hypothetical protein CYLTODRAFT_425844 [Cylindrobasidium torrendii FP15055 ss-10]
MLETTTGGASSLTLGLSRPRNVPAPHLMAATTRRRRSQLRRRRNPSPSGERRKRMIMPTMGLVLLTEVHRAQRAASHDVGVVGSQYWLVKKGFYG